MRQRLGVQARQHSALDFLFPNFVVSEALQRKMKLDLDAQVEDKLKRRDEAQRDCEKPTEVGRNDSLFRVFLTKSASLNMKMEKKCKKRQTNTPSSPECCQLLLILGSKGHGL